MERFNSERRLRMGLEMEGEEDAKQIVAVGAGTEEERWMERERESNMRCNSGSFVKALIAIFF